MNRQTLIVLGGGLCVALLVALLMQAMVGSPNSTDGEAVQTTSVLVAAKNLSIGDTLDATSMTWKKLAGKRSVSRRNRQRRTCLKRR